MPAIAIRSNRPPGKIVFRFHSRDLHMVLGPTKNGTPTLFKVKLNGVAATIYPIPAPMASARIDSRGCISSCGGRNRSTR